MRTRRLKLAILGCLLLWTTRVATAPAPKEHEFKVGKKGEFTLTKATMVSNVVLQPDTYVVQHRMDKNGNHFVRFTELKQVEAYPDFDLHDRFTYTEEDKAGEVKCRVEPAPGPIKKTAVYISTDRDVVRIKKVLIKGENVVHVLL